MSSACSEESGDNINGVSSPVGVIRFQANDTQYCREIVTKNCKIIGSAGDHDHGSSKVKLKNVVDYKWEEKSYPGHLIAVHMDGKYFAYVIKGKPVNKTTADGMVRVSEQPSGLRALIKGMTGEVLDLQFAHIEKEHILAAIDASSLFVYKIEPMSGSLNCSMILKIDDPILNYGPKFDKISWCPFIESTKGGDDDSDDDENKVIVWARGSKFLVFNVATIVEEYGTGPVERSVLVNGCIEHNEPSETITWVALSPDGTTMSVGYTNGLIRFYQVYFHDSDPRCLHQWKPHDGRPVSSFHFLDNLNNNKESYWKYAITAADNNTEFKVWYCGNWTCLQTVHITTANASEKPPRFIAEMDHSASYLVLSNFETRNCYVLQIVNLTDKLASDLDESFKSAASSTSLDTVFIKSVSEFPLSWGILSLSIVDAAVRQYKCGSDNYLLEELDDYDEETIYCVVVRMFIVQPKSLQECRILYQPMLTENVEVKSSMSASSLETSSSTNAGTTAVNGNADIAAKGQDSIVVGIDENNKVASDALGTLLGLSKPTTPSIGEKSDKSGSVSPPSGSSSSRSTVAYGGGQVNLMTPDAFSSSDGTKSPSEVSSDVLNTILMLANVAGPSAQKPENILNLVNNKIIESQEQQKISLKKQSGQKKFVAIGGENLTSGGSSPSREVQEIMSYQGNSFSGDELIEEDSVLIAPTAAADVPSAAASTNVAASGSGQSKRSAGKHSAELQNAANLISQAVNASTSSTSGLNHVVAPPAIISGSGETATKSGELAEISQKMNQLMEMIRLQSLQIKSLQSDLRDVRDSNPLGTAKGRDEFSFKLEMQLSKLMENYLKRYENDHKKKLSAFVTAREAQNRDLRDIFVQVVNSFVLPQMNEMLTKSMAIEVQRQIVPLLAMKLDALHTQLQHEIGKQFSSFDLMLKENTSQLCQNKNVIDTFGKSVLLGVQGSLQAAFIESMSSTLIPAYEKSSQNMFKQLHEAFSVGIKDFLEQFSSYLRQLQPMHDKSEQILNKVSDFRNHFDSILNQQRSIMAEAMLETRKDVKSLEILLTRQIQESLRKSFETQAAVVLRSQANTPAPPMYDGKETIRAYLQQGQINKAFHQALLANDLSLVEFTLKNVDCNVVFSPHCQLEQKVLLSLIQQISADMSHHDEIKQNYLSEALLAIDVKDPISREHAPKVIQELFRNCQSFLIQHPRSPQCTNVRMLLKGVTAYKDLF